MALLDVQALSVRYATQSGERHAVSDVSFQLDHGEYLGIVGESGCGKSTLVKALLGILPSNGYVSEGRIEFDGTDLVTANDRDLRAIRWSRISLVSQSAMNALDPVVNVGNQIIEAIRTHRAVSREEARRRVIQVFQVVGLDPRRLDDYPHQLSGGMRQRAMIAMALALDPDLVIGDEPTTGLDVIMQDQILQELKRLQEEQQRAMMLITHNVAAVTESCDRVVVMYAGELMESGDTAEVFSKAFNPYTLGLRNAFPSLKRESVDGSLISIPGSPPDLMRPSVGCCFADRCPFAEEICREEAPPLVEVGEGHLSKCHFPDRADEFRDLAALRPTWEPEGAPQKQTWTALVPDTATTQERLGGFSPKLEVDDLRTYFPVRQGLMQSVFTRSRSYVHAVDGVSFELMRGRILGLAGESGCGKSTTGMTLVRLHEPTSGAMRLGDVDVAKLSGRGGRLKAYRRRIQAIFQDPYGSLNPRFTIGQTVEEVLKVHGIGDSVERRARAMHALDLVELTPPEEYYGRFPHQLSGGQRQRVSIARAIVLEPDFLVADEPVSMLDVSVQAGVLNLLRALVDDLDIGLLYITHDLSTMRHICDEVAIMYVGKIVEHGPAEQVLMNPKHPYAQALVAAVPVPDPSYRRERIALSGEVPTAVDPPPGCRFVSRCPVAMEECREATPVLATIEEGERRVACFRYHSEGLDRPAVAPAARIVK